MWCYAIAITTKSARICVRTCFRRYMAKKGRPKSRADLSPSLLKEVKDRIRRTGSAESVYEQLPRIITKHTYDSWQIEFPEFSEEINVALADYRRSQPDYFINLAKACVEDYLTCHKSPRVTTSRTKRTRYVPNKKKPDELVLDCIDEVETTNEVILRCPPKIIEMIMPAIPRTTIDVLATQMANEGILPQSKAETIMAIADQAQTTIREVLSGGLSDTEEEL